MRIEIKRRHTGEILYAAEAESLCGCVILAVKNKANLTGADLRGADLHGANLHGDQTKEAQKRKRQALKRMAEHEAQYGDTIQMFVDIAALASEATGKKITPLDVVDVQIALKQVRIQRDPDHDDSHVDLIGYRLIREKIEKWLDG